MGFHLIHEFMQLIQRHVSGSEPLTGNAVWSLPVITPADRDEDILLRLLICRNIPNIIKCWQEIFKQLYWENSEQTDYITWK